MVKVILAIILLLILVPAMGAFSLILWSARKQPPAYGNVVEKYYVCHQHNNLFGGIFGKGPTKRFSGKGERDWCWRDEWQEIDRDTFKRLASEWYGVDWSEEIPFWAES